MLRIEILFDRTATRKLKNGTFQALRAEIERRLTPRHPSFVLRIDISSQSSLSISGVSDTQVEKIREILEEIWMDDAGLPAA